MYLKECELKQVIYENVCHAVSRDSVMFYTSAWVHQPYIEERAELLLQSMLTETGHVSWLSEKGHTLEHVLEHVWVCKGTEVPEITAWTERPKCFKECAENWQLTKGYPSPLKLKKDSYMMSCCLCITILQTSWIYSYTWMWIQKYATQMLYKTFFWFCPCLYIQNILYVKFVYSSIYCVCTYNLFTEFQCKVCSSNWFMRSQWEVIVSREQEGCLFKFKFLFC